MGEAAQRAGLDPALATGYEVHAHQHRLLFADAVLDVARDEAGRRLSLAESAGRAWAAGIGVPVPEVRSCAPDGAVLLGERCEPVPAPDPRWVDAAVDVARQVAAAPTAPDLPASSWRASRWSLPVRAVRALRGRVPVREFVAARAAAAALPADAVAHGDFHLRNVLRRAGGPAVVDWEFLAAAPADTDVARLFVTLPTAELRAHLAARLVAETPPERRAALAVLLRWAALHALAEQADGLRVGADRAGLRSAHTVRAEAAELGQRLSSRT